MVPDLPPEIKLYILKFIRDEKTILQVRLVCREWLGQFLEVPNYCEGTLIGISKFTPRKFTYQDMDGHLLREIKFKSYGRWEYRELSPLGIIVRTIKSKNIFQTEMLDNTHPDYQLITTRDSRYGEIKERKVSKIIMMPPCVIS